MHAICLYGHASIIPKSSASLFLTWSSTGFYNSTVQYCANTVHRTELRKDTTGNFIEQKHQVDWVNTTDSIDLPWEIYKLC